MRAFQQLTAVALPLYLPNVDTDAIIPSRAIRSTSRQGLGKGLFANLRYLPGDVAPNPDFILNAPEYRRAQILIGGENFGCGSSREQAVWALTDYGFRALIAPSYGSIFQRNCIHSGLLPVQLPAKQVSALAEWVRQQPEKHRLSIDLRQQQVQAQGSGEAPIWFDIDADAREMLLSGQDAVTRTLNSIGEQLSAFEKRDRRQRPWLHGTSHGASHGTSHGAPRGKPAQ